MTAERPEVEAAALPHEGVNAHSAHTIVIVGAGQAGGWAAQALRSEGFAGRVVLIGDKAPPAIGLSRARVRSLVLTCTGALGR